MSMSTILISNSTFEIFVIHTSLFQIHKFRKVLIILINDSSESNHSSKYTFLVVVAFTRKEETKRANTQPSSEYCSVCMIFIL